MNTNNRSPTAGRETGRRRAPLTEQFDTAEEHVVLAPPEDVSLTETARIATIATHIARSSEAPLRRAVPIWVVAAALIGGASITLSAQGVMRRPARTAAKTDSGAAAAPATVTHPLIVRSSPIVVPSTLAAPGVASVPESRPATTRELRSVTTVEGPRRGGNKHPAAHASPEPRGRKRSSAAKWVDPFAKSGPAMLAATTPRRGSTNTLTKTRWVDPFAN
jgi:hypothetical protein